MNDEVPVLRDTLSLKTIEAVEEIIAKRQAEVITEAQFVTALHAINSATSGMLNDDAMSLLSVAIPKHREVEHKSIVMGAPGKQTVMVICHLVGAGTVKVVQVNPVENVQRVTNIPHHDLDFPDQAAVATVNKLKESLEKQGYRRIC